MPDLLTAKLYLGGTLLGGGTGGGGSILDRINARLAESTTRAVRIGDAGSSTAAADPGFFRPLISYMQTAYPSGGSNPAVQVSTTATFSTPSTAPGIHGYNFGVGGTRSDTFLDADMISRVAALNLDLQFITVGSNNFFGHTDPAVYRSQLADKIAALKTVAPNCLFVLVHSFHRLDVTNPVPPWSAYGQAQAELAAADPTRVVAVDLSGLFVPSGVPGADPADLISTDNIHANATGYALLAEGARLALGIPGAPVTAAPPVDTTAPSVPTGLTVGAITSSSVALSWTASTDAVGVTGYRVRRGGTLVGSPTGTTFTDTGLTASTAYSYTVSAVDAAGNESSQTGAATATTAAPPADSTPPTVPTGLTVGTVTTTNVPLTWTASTDAVGVTGYRVYRGGTLVGSPTATSYTDTGLSAGTTYSYTVSAVDAAGNESAQTAAASATTAAATGTIADNFNRADAADLVGSVTPIGGVAWTGPAMSPSGTPGAPSSATTMGIVSNRATKTAGTGTTPRFLRLIDTGSATGKVMATLAVCPATAGEMSGGLVLKSLADGTALAYLSLRSGPSTPAYAFWQIASDGAGAALLNATTASIVPATGDVIEVTRNANGTMTALVNGVQACTSSAVQANLTADTHAGFFGNGSFTAVFDDITFTPAA